MSSEVTHWTIFIRSPKWRRYFAMRRWHAKSDSISRN
nr:MAG TPA: hypothetical protein [Caudoviricetes sp.]